MADHTRPTDPTREAEVKAADREHGADRGPTADEERAAERHDVNPEAAAHARDMNERGARSKGEGRIT